MSASRALRATYRLQLHKEFTFDDTREIVPYLERLGVSHVYTSPVLGARPGSTHGYDVADPTQANPELGGEDARRRFVEELDRFSLGWLLDIVPNHMGTGTANPFWEDVLAHGASSRYAHWFDIGWRAPGQPLRGRVLLPVLGDKLRAIVERGELTIAVADDGKLRLAYFENTFPIDPGTYPSVLALALDAEGGRNRRSPRRAPVDVELERIIDALAALPRHDDRGEVPNRDRGALAADALRDLEALHRRSRVVRQRIAAAARTFGRGAKGRERMRELVEAQPYRLAFWRRAARLVNYRRFFDINELVALHMEDERVFAETHARILEWVRAGDVTGLRIDHIDGLLDPLTYLERLRAALPEPKGSAPPFPIVVEKILSPGEKLREEWPVQGTTGYEYLNDLEALFLDPDGARAIVGGYLELLPRGLRAKLQDFQDVAIRGKLRILGSSLSADVRRLAALLHPLARRDRRVARVSRTGFVAALTEWLACFPVYRTYIDGRGEPAESDRAIVERVVERCRERRRLPEPLIEFLCDVMLDRSAPDRDERLRVVARLQQTSGPATAKGVEDTALYQYVPIASLNEVGGEPDRELADSVRRFHEGSEERARRWSQNLLCTNTHDTKRSADVRARLDVLSEIPDVWIDTVRRWRRMNAAHRKGKKGAAVDANTEYLLYQTLVGVWPLPAADAPAVPDRRTLGELRQRVEKYMEKAVREGKLRSSWTDPDAGFEETLKSFIGALLPERGAAKSPFLTELAALVGKIARPGLWNALARVVAHLASPGTPDLYQGDELWNFALVDPDNRRPVDFERRASLLDELEERQRRSEGPWPFVRDLASRPEDDRLKLWLTWRMLQARRAHEPLFVHGEYIPLELNGRTARHAVAFARRTGEASAIALVSRQLLTLGGNSRDLPSRSAWERSFLQLPPSFSGQRWLCAITGRVIEAERHGSGNRLPIDGLLSGFPAAFLLGEASARVGA